MRLRPRIGYSFFDGGRAELSSVVSTVLENRRSFPTYNRCKRFVAGRNIGQRKEHPVP